MKKILLLGAVALSLVACERQQDNKTNKPEAVPEQPVTEQTIIDNKIPETAPVAPEKPPVTEAPDDLR